jgi:hypothetical protein
MRRYIAVVAATLLAESVWPIEHNEVPQQR